MKEAGNKEAENESAAQEQRITHDAISAVYRIIPGGVIPRILIVAFFVGVMWPATGHVALMVWGMMMVAIILLQYYDAISFNKQAVPYAETINWIVRLVLNRALLGVLLASTVFVFYNHETVEHRIFLIVLIVILGTSAILGSLYYLPLFYVYAGPIHIALAIRFAMEGT